MINRKTTPYITDDDLSSEDSNTAVKNNRSLSGSSKNPEAPNKISNTQFACYVKVRILAKRYPNVELSKQQVNNLQNTILTNVLRQRKQKLKPKFDPYQIMSGLLIVPCKNLETVDWLKNIVPTISIEPHIELGTVDDKHLPQPAILTCVFPKSVEDTNDKIFAFLESQNEELVIDAWRIVKRDEIYHQVVLYFRVDNKSLQTIIENNCILDYKFGKVRIHLQSCVSSIIDSDEGDGASTSGGACGIQRQQLICHQSSLSTPAKAADSSHQSRPGTVSRTVEGVSQRAIPAKYSQSGQSVQLPNAHIGSNSWFYYQNVRGLRTKIDDLFKAICDCSYDVIILTETGLNDNIISLLLFGTNFNVFRCDRSPRNSDKSTLGGVLIAVASRFNSVEIQTTNGGNLEQVSVSATIRGKKILICAIYIPADRSKKVDVYNAHLASLRELCDKASGDDIVLVCGDYNQPHIVWEMQDDDGAIHLEPSLTSIFRSPSTALVDGVGDLNLQQFNSIKNIRGRVLDLVFCRPDVVAAVYESASPLLPIDAHHPPLVIAIPIQPIEDSDTLNVEERPVDYAKEDIVAQLSQSLEKLSPR